MAALEPGDEVAVGGGVVVPDAEPGTPLVVGECIGEFPHGFRYRARKDHTPVLLTVVDPVLCADLATRSALTRNLQASAKTEHRSLLPVYGWEVGDAGYIIVEADPGGTTVRDFVRHRALRGKPLDAETVYTVVAHVCNALAALHPQIHAYVTADTVLVSTSGRVYVSSRGIGPTLPQARNFPKFHNAGRLPNIAPEQLLSPPQLSEGTDIYGAATLFIEMATGRPMVDAGQPIEELGLTGPKELVFCLERATAPSPSARPPDIPTFKAELSEAVRSGPLTRADPVAPAPAEPSTGMPPHPYAGGRRVTPVPYTVHNPNAAHHWKQPPPYHPGAEEQLLRVPPSESGPIDVRRRGTPLPSPELEELDRAVRKIAALDDDAALAVTESVARVHDPNAEDDDVLPSAAAAATASASSSLLGLGVGGFEEAAKRLSTVDGEHVAANDTGPASSGNYFGAVLREEKNKPDTKKADLGLGVHAEDEHDQRPLYFLIGRSGASTGPHSAFDLARRARAGELAPEDLLRHRDTGEELPTGKHPALRKHFHLQHDLGPMSAPRPQLMRPAVDLPQPQRTGPPGAPAPPTRTSGIGTLWLVLGVLAAFAIAGYFLMNR